MATELFPCKVEKFVCIHPEPGGSTSRERAAERLESHLTSWPIEGDENR